MASFLTVFSVALVITGATSRAILPDFRRQASVNENGLGAGQACKSVTVIFARGTTEAGNVGSVAGPPMFAALRSVLGEDAVAVQGVEYPADVAGFLEGGDTTGSATMASLINEASTSCPDTKLVVSGYSQGAQLVHNAAKTLSAQVTAQISSVVVFGDPDNGQAVGNVDASKVKSFCHPQDIICTKTGSFASHLTYGIEAQNAAMFIQANI